MLACGGLGRLRVAGEARAGRWGQSRRVVRQLVVTLLLASCGEPSNGASDGPSPVVERLPDDKEPPRPKAPDVDAAIALTRALAAESKFGEALAELDKLTTTDAIGRARIQATRAYLQARTGGGRAPLDAAVAALEDLERLDAPPLHRLEANTAVGNIHWSFGEMDKARAAYERGLKLKVGDAPSVRRQRGRLLFNVAMLHAEAGRFDQALPPAQEGLVEEQAGGAEPCPGLSTTRAQLAAILARLNRPAEAVTLLDTARDACAQTPGMEVARAQLDAARADVMSLRWADVDLDTEDHDGTPEGQIEVYAADSKTHSDRTIYLNVCPAVRQLLLARRPADVEPTARVWDAYTEKSTGSARHRLHEVFGGPAFLYSTQYSAGAERSPPTLRSTCATFLHCSPGLFGGGGVHMARGQLGHSVAVARKHYAERERGIPRDARTLEAAMRIESLIADLL